MRRYKPDYLILDFFSGSNCVRYFRFQKEIFYQKKSGN